jgi:hypothetical protein
MPDVYRSTCMAPRKVCTGARALGTHICHMVVTVRAAIEGALLPMLERCPSPRTSCHRHNRIWGYVQSWNRPVARLGQSPRRTWTIPCRRYKQCPRCWNIGVPATNHDANACRGGRTSPRWCRAPLYTVSVQSWLVAIARQVAIPTFAVIGRSKACKVPQCCSIK